MLLAYNNPFWEILYQTIPPNLVVLIIVADAELRPSSIVEHKALLSASGIGCAY